MKDKCTCTPTFSVALLAIGTGMFIASSAMADRGQNQPFSATGNSASVNQAAREAAQQLSNTPNMRKMSDRQRRAMATQEIAAARALRLSTKGQQVDGGIAGANCPNPANDCCAANATPGCADEACCTAVCACDPFCCNTAWDIYCAGNGFSVPGCGAQALCGCEGGGGPCPNPDHDCFTTGTPGCSDEACCNTVCASDPFCCDTAWDGLCVNGAITLCGGSAPANDNCIDRIDAFVDVPTAFSNIGATTDGVPHGLCNFFGDSDVGSDIWYNFIAGVTDVHSISLCGSGYDTKVAVYAGCGVCPPTDAELVACNDDSCGLQSEAQWNGVAGTCYKIRIGGFAGSQGSGTFTIFVGAPPSPCDSADHPCDVTGGPGCTDIECCETVCALDPFCCDVSWDGICVNEAAQFCGDPCVVECVNTEGEECGSDTNGGCNSVGGCSGASGTCCVAGGAPGCSDPTCQAAICAADPFCCDVAWDGLCSAAACADDVNCQCDPSTGDPFGTIACGETVCGNMWASGGTRDTDWYRFTLTGAINTVNLTLNSEFPGVSFIIADGCPPVIIAQGVGQCPTVATANGLGPGTYVAFAAPAAFDGAPCGGDNNDYTLTLECIDPCGGSSCQGDTDGDGDVDVDDLLNVINGWGACP